MHIPFERRNLHDIRDEVCRDSEMYGKDVWRMKQMDLLEEYLREKEIRYERKDIDGGEQIMAYSKNGDRLWDAICTKYSYGHEKGLIEIMGNIVDRERVVDGVEGCLTAQDVIDRVEGRL